MNYYLSHLLQVSNIKSVPRRKWEIIEVDIQWMIYLTEWDIPFWEVNKVLIYFLKSIYQVSTMYNLL